MPRVDHTTALTNPRPTPTMSAQRLVSIEVLRGFAALLVCIGHTFREAHHFGLLNIEAVARWRVWTAGVDLFFIISGFIMIWTFGRKFGVAGAPRDFISRRLMRVVPLYWVFTVLIVGATLVTPDSFDRARFELLHVFQSLLFIPHFAPDGGFRPILAAGWTLDYEMFFYAIFAIALFLPRRLGIGFIALVMTSVFAAFAWSDFGMPGMHRFFGYSVILEFLLGLGIGALVQTYGFRRSLLLYVAAAALAIVMVSEIASGGASPGFGRFFTSGLPALALFCGFLALDLDSERWWKRGAVLMGAASYSLYLCHPFVIGIVKPATQIIAHRLHLPEILAFPIYVVASVVASVVTAVFIWYVVEMPMLGWLRRRPSDRAQPAMA